MDDLYASRCIYDTEDAALEIMGQTFVSSSPDTVRGGAEERKVTARLLTACLVFK